jgi:redox-sensitive bicupin YhaK (pirin superfamily)
MIQIRRSAERGGKRYVSLLKPGEEVAHEFSGGRHGWLQVARGAVEVNGKS